MCFWKHISEAVFTQQSIWNYLSNRQVEARVRGKDVGFLETSLFPAVKDGIEKQNKKQTPWLLVRKRTVPTQRPPLVDENLGPNLWIEGCRVVSAADPLRSLISVF
jgi:hypothetical protein